MLQNFVHDHSISESEFIEQNAITDNMLENIQQQDHKLKDEIMQNIRVTSLTDMTIWDLDMAIWDLFNAQAEMTGTEQPSIDILTRCAGMFDEMLTFATRNNLKELYGTTIDDIDLIK